METFSAYHIKDNITYLFSSLSIMRTIYASAKRTWNIDLLFTNSSEHPLKTKYISWWSIN